MTDHQTDFHNSVSGPLHTGSGDINYIVSSFGSAYQELREALPEDHPAIQSLRESLIGLAIYHELINEWKELHNLLQELLNAVDQFHAEVERLYDRSADFEVRVLRRRWRPCQRRIRMLAGFASNVKHICPDPYREGNRTLRGPDWVVEIVLRQRDVEDMLGGAECDVSEMYELAIEFSDVCHTHLYLADKSLRDSAGELSMLSNRILAKVVG